MGLTRSGTLAFLHRQSPRSNLIFPRTQGRKVVDASDCYVTPGLIDLHAHCYLYGGAMFPDELCFPYGVTTMVDCGGSGWRTFDHFNETVIRKAGPRVFALLNIVGHGMCGDGEQDVDDMDVELTAAKIRQRSDVIVGVKVGPLRWCRLGVGGSWGSRPRLKPVCSA